MAFLSVQLEGLGLSHYEGMILSVLIESSPTSATHIAKKCDLSRSSVYTCLSALIAKGLVATTHKNEVKQFMFTGLDAVESLLVNEQRVLDERRKLLKAIRPAIVQVQHNDHNVPQTIFFEGQEGLRTIYLSMMREAPKDATMRIIRDEFLWTDAWKFAFEEDWRRAVRTMKVERNVHTKLLVNDSQEERSHAEYYKHVKGFEYAHLPKAHQVHNFALYTVGDIVSIMSMEDNGLMGIKITNTALAKNYVAMFETLWDASAIPTPRATTRSRTFGA